MRAVLTRVKNARVEIDGKVNGAIDQGFLVLLGVGVNDTEAQAVKMADKICGLRIFEDENEKMNLSVEDIGGEILVVSQFTLFGDCRKGKRPNFTSAGKPDYANKMYEDFVEYIKSKGIKTGKGIFGADMKVSLLNDGPVTIMIDSKKTF